LTLWGLFSSGITHSTESLLSSSQMIRKIYFPRILIPLASLLTALIDFAITLVLLILLLLFFRQPVNLNIIYCFPLAILLTFISAFGIGSLLAALNVKYRDFRYLLPFGMQLLFFSSQIVYSIHSMKEGWISQLLYLNPLNGALELLYYPFQNSELNSTGVLISAGCALFFLTIGLYYFKKTEAYFADII
jgi:lipopolysaccharide transport system permease protein